MAITNKMRNAARQQALHILQQLREARFWLSNGREYYGHMTSWESCVDGGFLRINLASGALIRWRLGKLVLAELLAMGS